MSVARIYSIKSVFLKVLQKVAFNLQLYLKRDSSKLFSSESCEVLQNIYELPLLYFKENFWMTDSTRGLDISPEKINTFEKDLYETINI